MGRADARTLGLRLGRTFEDVKRWVIRERQGVRTMSEDSELLTPQPVYLTVKTVQTRARNEPLLALDRQ
jgi:hypothetical protein